MRIAPSSDRCQTVQAVRLESPVIQAVRCLFCEASSLFECMLCLKHEISDSPEVRYVLPLSSVKQGMLPASRFPCRVAHYPAMSFKPTILLQHLAPKLMLTRLAGTLANCRKPWLAQYLIRDFLGKYDVNLSEAVLQDPALYGSFNDFFTRELRPGVRPLAQADWVCPVDGAVSQFGRVRDGQLIQAKGQDYSAAALLGDASLAAAFKDGHFATLYLSPKDYHRIHMPCAGRLLGMRHVPGELFSVNPVVVEGVPGLFARNERLVCWFEHPQYGMFVLVLVGAAIVGSIGTTWHGIVTPPRRREARQWLYGEGGQPAPAAFAQGQEMGRFQLGSTVVALLPPGDWRFNPAWQDGSTIRLGERMADLG